MKTTILTLSFILISFFSKSQNWKSVPLNDTIYYTTTIDSLSNLTGNYLRCVFLDSMNIIGNDEVYFFHPTIQNGNWSSSQNCIDTLSSSFMGKKYIRKINGDEMYFNFRGDTTILKTYAQLNDSWTCATDSSGLYIIATVTNLSTQIIDNTLDSIKEITLQAWFNGNTTTHYSNGYKIILSKQHGIIKCLQWEDFPYNFNLPYFLSFHPHFSYVLERLNNQYESIDFNKVDFTTKYTPGNEWIYEVGSGFRDYKDLSNGNSSGTIYTIHDSVLSGYWINATEFEATYLRKRKRADYHSYNIPPNPFDSAVIYSDSTWVVTDTLFNNVDSIFLHPKICVEYGLTDTSFHFPNFYVPHYFGIDTSVCGFAKLEAYGHNSNMLSLDTCVKIVSTVSGYSEKYIKYYSSLGFTEGFEKSYNIGYFLTWNSHSILHYFKIQNCIEGVKFDVLALNTNDYNLNDKIAIYPNPTKDILFINLSDNSIEILSIKLYTITGQLISENKNTNSISLENIPKGLYLIEIKTSKGSIRKKIFHN